MGAGNVRHQRCESLRWLENYRLEAQSGVLIPLKFVCCMLCVYCVHMCVARVRSCGILNNPPPPTPGGRVEQQHDGLTDKQRPTSSSQASTAALNMAISLRTAASLASFV